MEVLVEGLGGACIRQQPCRQLVWMAKSDEMATGQVVRLYGEALMSNTLLKRCRKNRSPSATSTRIGMSGQRSNEHREVKTLSDCFGSPRAQAASITDFGTS